MAFTLNKSDTCDDSFFWCQKNVSFSSSFLGMNVFATNELCSVRKKRLSGDCKLMRRSIRRKLEAPIEKKKKGQGG